MSGICGRVDFSGEPQETTLIERMTERLRHRGKCIQTARFDGAVFGHIGEARVPGEQSTAPVHQFCMFDGWIANLEDLRIELGVSGPPEEVLRAAYQRWGADFVSHLVGAFSIALWDAERRTAILARDPIGAKPLYYYPLKDGVVFGSEPKAIWADARLAPVFDREKLNILLQPRLTQPGETPLRNLFEVKPGHLVMCQRGGLKEKEYWRLESRPHEHDYNITKQTVRDLLEASVASASSNQEQCGVMLSGGLDSTAVAALIKGARVFSYCVNFGEARKAFVKTNLRPDIDAPFAVAAAGHIGAHHTEVHLSTADLWEANARVRDARDLPAWGQFDASMYCLFREMSQQASVGLSGEAADELFGGYPLFFDPAIVARDTFPWLGQGIHLRELVNDDYLPQSEMRADEVARYRTLMARVPRLAGENSHDARLRELQYLCLAGPLSVVLDRKDRMSSAWGLDVRLPFCNHKLLEYAWNIPWSMKCATGVKGILRDAVRDVLPESTLNRRKSAYPHTQDAQYHDLLMREVLEICDGPNSGALSIIDPKATRDLVQRLAQEPNDARYPGGAAPAYLLVHIVELHHWLINYNVSIS